MELRIFLYALLGLLLLSSQLIPVIAQGGKGEPLPNEDDVEVTEEDESTSPHQTSTTEPTAGGTEEYEEDIDEAGGEELELKPSQFVSTAVLFPENPDRKFPIGGEIVVLMGFSNNGDESYNITDVGAHLHYTYDLSYFIQNYTSKSIGVTVPPHEQVSVEYTFKPDKSLVDKFWLSGYVLYNVSGKNLTHMDVFYNDTIELVEKQSEVNVRRVFSYFFALALAGIVGYSGYYLSLSKSARRRVGRRARGEKSDTSSNAIGGSSGAGRDVSGATDSVVDDWGATVYKQARQSKVVRPRKNKQKK